MGVFNYSDYDDEEEDTDDYDDENFEDDDEFKDDLEDPYGEDEDLFEDEEPDFYGSKKRKRKNVDNLIKRLLVGLEWSWLLLKSGQKQLKLELIQRSMSM